MNDYDPIADAWKGTTVPPLDTPTAARAHALLCKRFGSLTDYPAARATYGRRVMPMRSRRVWVSTVSGYDLSKGWARLVHDTSHRIFARRHPSARPHAHGHDKLELELARFVIESGWLDGRIALVKPAPTRADLIRLEMKRTEARARVWRSKRDRAVKAFDKCINRLNVLQRRLESC